MKKVLIPALFLFTIGCATHDSNPLFHTYPCSMQHPCAQSTTHTIPLLLSSQMHECGGFYRPSESHTKDGIIDVTAACSSCRSKRHFFFIASPDLPSGKTLMAAFDHAAQLVKDGKTREAIPWIEDLIQEEPHFVQAIVLLAQCYTSIGDWDKAHKALERAAALSATYPEFYSTRAQLAIAEGDSQGYDEAMAIYRMLFNRERR